MTTDPSTVDPLGLPRDSLRREHISSLLKKWRRAVARRDAGWHRPQSDDRAQQQKYQGRAGMRKHC